MILPKRETGYYCRIIGTVKDANPDARIELMNIFATKGDEKPRMRR